jgi:hypothetical protein
MRRLTLAVLCLLVLLPVAPAAASTRDKIIRDCADDGVLQGHYSPSALRDARQNLPSDVAEYTDCADVLRRAELPSGGSGSGGGTGGATGGGGFGGPGGAAAAASGSGGGPLLTPSTPADHEALARAATSGGQPVTIQGQSVVPGASGLQASAIRNDVPTTLLVALVLLSLAGVALSVPGIRRLLPLVGRRRS